MTKSFVAHDDLDVRTHDLGELDAMRLTDHTDATDVKLFDHGREFAQLFATGNGDQFESLAFVAQDIQGLYANGTRRP